MAASKGAPPSASGGPPPGPPSRWATIQVAQSEPHISPEILVLEIYGLRQGDYPARFQVKRDSLLRLARDILHELAEDK